MMIANTRTANRPPLPGSILLAEYIRPRQLQIKMLAQESGISRKQMYKILNGEVRITPSTAARLALALRTSPGFWVSLQSAVDTYEAELAFDTYTTGEPRPLPAAGARTGTGTPASAAIAP